MVEERLLTAIQTSAGRGRRLRPLSLTSPTSGKPKSLMRIMGVPIAEIQMEQFKAGGITTLDIITQYLENRDPLANRFGDGSRFGMQIRYSDVSREDTNNGSGDAILVNLEDRRLTGDSLWLPNDNLFEFDLDRIVQEHTNLGGVVSILTVDMRPRTTIRNYGLIDADENHRVRRLIEKPDNEDEVRRALGLKKGEPGLNERWAVANTGGYLLNNDALAKICGERWVRKLRRHPDIQCDMAGRFIPGLLNHDIPVYRIPIDAWGDLGSTSFFLETFQLALAGTFPSISKILKDKGYYHDAENRVWIHTSSLNRVYSDGRTLQQMIENGDVTIGPNVFIGSDVIIENGTVIRYSDIEKDARIGANVTLDHAYLSPYCQVEAYAKLGACALGDSVRVRSSQHKPTHINGKSIIGGQVEVTQGTKLEEVRIFPGYIFDKNGETHKSVTLKPTIDQVHTVAAEYLKEK